MSSRTQGAGTRGGGRAATGHSEDRAQSESKAAGGAAKHQENQEKVE